MLWPPCATSFLLADAQNALDFLQNRLVKGSDVFVERGLATTRFLLADSTFHIERPFTS
jgi:hypothetical protein